MHFLMRFPIWETKFMDRINMNFLKIGLVALLSLGAARSSHAWDGNPVIASITEVEMTSIPNALHFKINQPVANCPAGNWITWDGGIAFPPGTLDESGRRSNVRNMAQTVLAQKITGSTVRVYARNTSDLVGLAGCKIEYFHAQ
jgi:hypothetical protein